MAALAGPPTPYTVISQPFAVGNGMENQPAMQHSCPLDMAGTTGYADPGVRIKQWLDGFGTNGVLDSICAAQDFKPVMVRIAEVIGRLLGAQCVTGNIANKINGEPDCEVTERQYDAVGTPVDTPIPHCTAGRSNAGATTPCWEFQTSPQCMGSQLLGVCYDAGCTAGSKPTTRTDALVECALN